METPTLDKILEHHARTCTMHLYHMGADRKCSCGRDKALEELQALKAEAEQPHQFVMPLFASSTAES